MKNNIVQHILEALELNFSHEWNILPSKPSDTDNHAFLIAINPSKKLLTDDLKLTDAVIIGKCKIVHQLIDMLQNDNLQIGYVSVKGEDKTMGYEKLHYAIRMVLINSW